ncbi:MAG TPA: hypothetical protein VE981_13495 [Planctomycetota bacterium]|nr:hypothetical protein [Planctomycetota bacterium]
MAGMSGSAPRERQHLSGATVSLISIAYSELRRDIHMLLDSRWNESIRRRAGELSSALVMVCLRQRLDGLLPLFRSVSNLARLSQSSARPLLPSLREKFESLMTDIEAALPRRPDRAGG